jgi:hypothetical protein
MDLKPVTTQKVRAVLRKAGVRLSTSSTTAVKGWHDHTEGYEVHKYYPDRIAVDYTFGTWGNRYDHTTKRIQLLDEVCAILETANIVCEWSEGSHPSIICLGLKDQQ